MSRYADYANPKPLNKPLTPKEEAFLIGLVDSKLEPIDAFKAAGYSEGSEGLSKHRAKRIQKHLWLHIEKRIQERVGETATLALNVLEELKVKTLGSTLPGISCPERVTMRYTVRKQYSKRLTRCQIWNLTSRLKSFWKLTT